MLKALFILIALSTCYYSRSQATVNCKSCCSLWSFNENGEAFKIDSSGIHKDSNYFCIKVTWNYLNSCFDSTIYWPNGELMVKYRLDSAGLVIPNTYIGYNSSGDLLFQKKVYRPIENINAAVLKPKGKDNQNAKTIFLAPFYNNHIRKFMLGNGVFDICLIANLYNNKEYSIYISEYNRNVGLSMHNFYFYINSERLYPASYRNNFNVKKVGGDNIREDNGWVFTFDQSGNPVSIKDFRAGNPYNLYGGKKSLINGSGFLALSQGDLGIGDFVQISSLETYTNSRKDGIQATFMSNQNLNRTIQMVNDTIHGKLIYYDASGCFYEVSHFEKGVQVGPIIIYEDCMPKYRIKVVEGIPTGPVEKFNYENMTKELVPIESLGGRWTRYKNE